MAGVNGVRGFLDRAWRMIIDERAEQAPLHPAVQAAEPTSEQNRVLHRTIMAVTRDTARLEFNTAIARMMEFVNYFTKQAVRRKRRWSAWCCCWRPTPRTSPRSCGTPWATPRRWPTSRGRSTTRR